MCDGCIAHFYHPEPTPGPTIFPPREPHIYPDDQRSKSSLSRESELPPLPPLPSSRITIVSGAREIEELTAKKQLLEDKVRQLERRAENAEQERDTLNTLCESLMHQLGRGENPSAILLSDDFGLYVLDTKRREKHTLVRFAPSPGVAEFMQARQALCRYPYLQDESCKLPAGHIGDHGPQHQCNVDCALSDGGCTLPIPENPAAYWQALYWELHGSSCPPTCRGHAS